MIKIGIVGDIGSGKSYVAKQFGYPVFSADNEVEKLYKKSRKCYYKLKKKLPNYITSFPIQKSNLSKAIIKNSNNLKKIEKVIHPLIRAVQELSNKVEKLEEKLNGWNKNRRIKGKKLFGYA